MQYIKVNEIENILTSLKHRHVPFTMESTTFTKKVVTDHKIYHLTGENNFYPCESALIRMVKMYCDRIPNEDLPKVNRKHITYIKNGEFKKGVYENEIYEIDLNRAFWEFSFREGFIDKKLYYRGLNCNENGTEITPKINSKGEVINYIRKKARLIAIGNVAKYKTILKFNGNFFSRPQKIPSRTENIFFKVAQLTDYTIKMLEIIAGNDFIFYWCDAIFFKGNDTKDKIIDFLQNEMNFEFKIVNVNKININENSIIVEDDKHKDPRPFLFKPLIYPDLSEIIDIPVSKFNNKRFLKSRR